MWTNGKCLKIWCSVKIPTSIWDTHRNIDRFSVGHLWIWVKFQIIRYDTALRIMGVILRCRLQDFSKSCWWFLACSGHKIRLLLNIKFFSVYQEESHSSLRHVLRHLPNFAIINVYKQTNSICNKPPNWVILPYVSLKVHTAFIFSLNNRKNHQFYLKSAKNSFNKYTTI